MILTLELIFATTLMMIRQTTSASSNKSEINSANKTLKESKIPERESLPSELRLSAPVEST